MAPCHGDCSTVHTVDKKWHGVSSLQSTARYPPVDRFFRPTNKYQLFMIINNILVWVSICPRGAGGTSRQNEVVKALSDGPCSLCGTERGRA